MQCFFYCFVRNVTNIKLAGSTRIIGAGDDKVLSCYVVTQSTLCWVNK